MIAPIIVFVYNRPSHTIKMLESLEKNDLFQESVVYVYSDGPKEEENDKKLVFQTREIVKSKKLGKETILIENDKNNGLLHSIIKGIQIVFERFDKIIVIEDDLLLSPKFLTFINAGLDLYNDNSNIYSINGYMFPIKTNTVDSFLCPLATSTWGWGTWKSKWNFFDFINESDIKVIQSNKNILQRFNFADYPFNKMLSNKKSWAINWYYSVFLQNGLGLFPTKTLVKNIGFDGSGTNCANESGYPGDLYLEEIALIKKTKIDLAYYAQLLEYFTLKKETTLNKFLKYLKRD